MLNRLWFAFFASSFIACLYQWWFLGNGAVFSDVINAVFAMAETSVKIAIGLVGIMCFWLGLFRILEHTPMIHWLSVLLAPLLRHLMPGVPKDHPAQSAITMNLAANVLGLDNAATPLGIKAMQELQTLNPQKQVASDAQILFLVLNTSSVTLLPVTIFMYRAQAGAASATDVFLPILIATSCSTLAGLFAVSLFQRVRLYHPVVLAYLGAFALLMSLLMSYLVQQDDAALAEISSMAANVIMFSFILLVMSLGMLRKVEVYDLFIDGAKQGFETAISLIPYLVAMLVAIATLRASGVIDLLVHSLASLMSGSGWPTEWLASLPTAIIKPLSGSGARAMMLESFNAHGVDSLVGRMTSIMQGSTETTFYVLAVYFGSVGIRFGRHAVICGLIADAAGITAAIVCTYLFFSP